MHMNAETLLHSIRKGDAPETNGRLLLTVSETAASMGVSVRFILEEIKARRLKVARIGKGKAIRISPAAVAEYIENATITEVVRAVATTEGGV